MDEIILGDEYSININGQLFVGIVDSKCIYIDEEPQYHFKTKLNDIAISMWIPEEFLAR